MSGVHHAVDWCARADELERDSELGLPWMEAAVQWLVPRSDPHTRDRSR